MLKQAYNMEFKCPDVTRVEEVLNNLASVTGKWVTHKHLGLTLNCSQPLYCGSLS